MFTLGITFGSFVLVAVVVTLVASKMLRVAVKPNEVHIVQSRRKTVSYGKNSDAGNSYWAIPSWIPIWGVEVSRLPLSVFDLDLPNYEAYDVGKVPFVVDIKAFFRINNSNLAAERVKSLDELEAQLKAILQGTVRKVLAHHEIEEIMMERSKFGEMFTTETESNLAEWGVVNVKDIELMDVRDAPGSETVSNIMAKKESLIEKESRIVVALNKQEAAQKEIDAEKEVQLSQQDAARAVGERTAEKTRAVGIADEKALQEIKTQARITAEKDMDIQRVKDVKDAEIKRDVRVVQADEQRQTDVIESEGEKQKTVLIAEGNLESEKRRAEGIEAVGKANAEAKRLDEMAVVTPQIALAEEIGENDGYQSYLIKIRNVEKDETVGVESAKALQAAGIKIIANTGNVTDGLNNVLDIFSSKGGTHIGAMLEGLAQTDTGQTLLSKVGVATDEDKPPKRPSAKRSNGNGSSPPN